MNYIYIRMRFNSGEVRFRIMKTNDRKTAILHKSYLDGFIDGLTYLDNHFKINIESLKYKLDKQRNIALDLKPSTYEDWR